MGCNPAVVSAGNYHSPLFSKSFRCSSLTQHQSWLKLNGKNFHFLFSNPKKKKVCNEVSLPVRPLSLKAFPVEAVSVWWDQLLVLQPVKSRHFWNTCYIKETLWEKPLSRSGMFSCFSLLEWKFPHFFLPSKLQLIIKSMSWRLKEETQNINHTFSPFKLQLYSWKTSLLTAEPEQRSPTPFLSYQKICKAAFQTTRKLV